MTPRWFAPGHRAAPPCRNGWRPARWRTSLEPRLIGVSSTSARLGGGPPTPGTRRMTSRGELGRRKLPWRPARSCCASTPPWASCCRGDPGVRSVNRTGEADPRSPCSTGGSGDGRAYARSVFDGLASPGCEHPDSRLRERSPYPQTPTSRAKGPTRTAASRPSRWVPVTHLATPADHRRGRCSPSKVWVVPSLLVGMGCLPIDGSTGSPAQPVPPPAAYRICRRRANKCRRLRT
jgi:hypothetical protein